MHRGGSAVFFLRVDVSAGLDMEGPRCLCILGAELRGHTVLANGRGLWPAHTHARIHITVFLRPYITATAARLPIGFERCTLARTEKQPAARWLSGKNVALH